MFWNDLPKGGIAPELLPLFHTTESVNAREIFDASLLRVKECPHYAEDLLYFFYGKPSFRSGRDVQATTILEYYPFVLVVRPEAVEGVKRLMPFDSGGLILKFYKDHVHPNLAPQNFEIPPPIAHLREVVRFFFGSNLNYFMGSAKDVPDIRETQFELSALARMIRASGASSSDNRRISCEVQISGAVKLNGAGVLGVIAPTVFGDEPYFIDRCAEWGVDQEFYDVHLGTPSETYGEVFAASKRMLARWGMI